MEKGKSITISQYLRQVEKQQQAAVVVDTVAAVAVVVVAAAVVAAAVVAAAVAVVAVAVAAVAVERLQQRNNIKS